MAAITDDKGNLLDSVTPEMAYQWLVTRAPILRETMQMHALLVLSGRKAEEVVTTVLGSMREQDKQYAADHPFIKELIIRATDYAVRLARRQQHARFN